MSKHRHKRKGWKYKGCKITPCHDKTGRYFGNPDYPANKTQYRTMYWRCDFVCGGFRLFGTKGEVRDFLDNPRNEQFLQSGRFQ